ncbi:MAG: hypothetical protein KDD22_04555 [Bdellovibrionales bacterium]|nr:hypothetical protein [Bdellovibrionales bacterium]
MKNEIVKRVNSERVAKGAEGFEIVGFLTGITGGSELDPNVDVFHVSNAFYWDDYFGELLDVLRKFDTYKFLEIEFPAEGVL